MVDKDVNSDVNSTNKDVNIGIPCDIDTITPHNIKNKDYMYQSSEKNYHLAYYPKGNSSWRGFQRDEAEKTYKYVHGSGLPLSVITHVKPIVEDLSGEKLLRKCLHGKTQNNNESINRRSVTDYQK